MLNNNKKETVNKSQLIFKLKDSNIASAITYDLLTDKDRKECLKDIETNSKNKKVSVVLIVNK